MSKVTKTQKFQILLSMYCTLDDWARKHGVVLFLDAGTCLGAVRHRGFIPWDFDLDVAVTWGYYQKMMAAWEEDPIPGYEIVNVFRYEDYPSLFSRFVDTNTTEIRRASAWDLAPSGMSIDIFPLIPLPRDAKEKQRAKDAFLVYYELTNPIMLNKRTREDSMLKLLGRALRAEKLVGRKRVIERLRRVVMATPEEECEDYIRVSAGLREVWAVTKEELGGYAQLPFEGHMAYVPERYITYLQTRYGVGWRNYPKSRAGGYHYVENVNIPYDVYVNDYMQLLDKREVIGAFKDLKRKDLFDVRMRPRVLKEIYRTTIEPARLAVESYGDPAAYADSVPDDLARAIDNYVAVQFSRPFSYWRIWGGLPDEWLAVACKRYCRSGDYGKAMKLIKSREVSDARPLSGDLVAVRDRVHAIYRVYDDIDYGDVEGVRQALHDGRGLDSLVRRHAELYLACCDAEAAGATGDTGAAEAAGTTGDAGATGAAGDTGAPRGAGGAAAWERLAGAARNAQADFPGDYEFVRYEACALGHLGKTDDARTLLDQVIGKSENGMTVLRAKDDKENLGHA